MSDVTVPVGEAERIVVDALVASNTAGTNARSVASALVGAELCGQAGHGLRRVPAYASQARAGKVAGNAIPASERTRPGVVRIDAGHGFAYPALDLAIAELQAIVPEQGIGVAGIYRSHHAGVAGLTVERLAEIGFVALLVSNTPAAMAPWGARRPAFGTNPVAFACPAGEQGPIVVDVSLSKVARGKIMAAAQKGEAIPRGWALDSSGEPTTDAKAALAGTMVPLGEAKGAALALMIELLAAGLTGANYAYEQASFFDAEGAPPGTGQTLIAIDPDAFDGANCIARFAAMAATLAGIDGARIPGHRRRKLRAQLERNGIAVDRALLDEIRAIGGRSSQEP